MILAVDISALMAILNVESEAPAVAACLGSARRRLLSPANYRECGIVIGRHAGMAGLDRLRRLVTSARLELVGVETAGAELGVEAYRRFGKGSDHPTQLNFGGCFAYALAKGRDLPLLFKGRDFSHADIRPGLPA